jgi:hypothetical protein
MAAVPAKKHRKAYCCSYGFSVPSLCGGGVSIVPVLPDAPGTPGAVCSSPNGVVVGDEAGLGAGVVMMTEPPL